MRFFSFPWNIAPLKREAQGLYVGAMERARQPFFYQDLGVPDTAEGRFELLALHVFFTTHALQAEGRALLARYVTEAFVLDMDRSLRELGIGDTGVGKRVKKAATGLMERLKAYADAAANPHAFAQVVKEYVYTHSTADSAPLVRYAQAQLSSSASAA